MTAAALALAATCQITVRAEAPGVLRAEYNSPRLCGAWPPYWQSLTAQVRVLPKGKGYRVEVSGPPGQHLVLARIPGLAQGGTWVALGPAKPDQP